MIWKPNVTVAAVIEREGRYLLVEEVIDSKRVFNQPAGHLEPGESLIQAITREVLEETGRDFEPRWLIAVSLWQASNQEKTFLRFTFTGKVSDKHPNLALDEDIIATHWLTRQALEERQSSLRSPLVLESIASYESGQRYPLTLLQSFLPQ